MTSRSSLKKTFWRALAVASLVIGAIAVATGYALTQEEEAGPMLRLLDADTAAAPPNCDKRREIYASADTAEPRCFRRCASNHDCPLDEECFIWKVANSHITTSVCTKEYE